MRPSINNTVGPNNLQSERHTNALLSLLPYSIVMIAPETKCATNIKHGTDRRVMDISEE